MGNVINRHCERGVSLTKQSINHFTRRSEEAKFLLNDLRAFVPSRFKNLLSGLLRPPYQVRSPRNDVSNMRTSSQRGSAMIYIFIGIALFGLLMFVMSRSSNQSTTTLTDQQASIIASDIMNYGRSVQSAVNRLIAKGCSEKQISFQSSKWSNSTWYENPNSPVDKSCHVFESNGGKVKWKDFPTLQQSTTAPAVTFVTGNNNPVRKMGTDNLSDIYLRIESRSDVAKNYQNNLNVCKIINKINSVPEVEGSFEKLPSFYGGAANTYYAGTFYTAGPTSLGSDVAGKKAWCVVRSWSGTTGYILIMTGIYMR